MAFFKDEAAASRSGFANSLRGAKTIRSLRGNIEDHDFQNAAFDGLADDSG